MKQYLLKSGQTIIVREANEEDAIAVKDNNLHRLYQNSGFTISMHSYYLTDFY